MHTSRVIRTNEFTFLRGDIPVPFDEILPRFEPADRLGVVVTEPGGGIEAAPLLLAAVGAFYESLRSTGDTFYRYPDIFVFHVGRLHGYHALLDVWPERREVVSPPDPDALLGLINDRGITRLMIPNGPRAHGLLMRESVESGRSRLRSIHRFGGAPDATTVSVTSSPAACEFVWQAIDSLGGLLSAEQASRLREAVTLPQVYTPIDFDEATEMLCALGETDPVFGMTPVYRETQAVDEAAIRRHEFRVGQGARER